VFLLSQNGAVKNQIKVPINMSIFEVAGSIYSENTKNEGMIVSSNPMIDNMIIRFFMSIS